MQSTHRVPPGVSSSAGTTEHGETDRGCKLGCMWAERSILPQQIKTLVQLTYNQEQGAAQNPAVAFLFVTAQGLTSSHVIMNRWVLPEARACGTRAQGVGPRCARLAPGALEVHCSGIRAHRAGGVPRARACLRACPAPRGPAWGSRAQCAGSLGSGGRQLPDL